MYSILWKISGQTLFFRASASCSKILNDKKYFQYSENFQVNSGFKGKRKLLKNPEQWKNFQYSVFSAYSLRGDPCYLANWHYRRSRYKRIQLYRPDLQEVSCPIRIKLKKLVSGEIVHFFGVLLFSGQIFSAPQGYTFPYTCDYSTMSSNKF